jgi:predicted transcriptional regulator of viral defense system
VSVLNALIAGRGLITIEETDAFLRTCGTYSRRSRDRALAALCASGKLVRVQRGLYARATPQGGEPDSYHVASYLSPDAVLGLRTALEVHAVVAPDPAQCTYFAHLTKAGRGRTWRGTRMYRMAHPTALLRAGREFVETAIVDGRGGGQMRVATIERAFVDLLDRPRLTPGWPTVIQVLGAIPALDLDRVVQYVAYLDNATTAAKTGWILERYQERLGVTADVLWRLEQMRPRRPHYLSRSQRVSGRVVTRWNLVVPPTL